MKTPTKPDTSIEGEAARRPRVRKVAYLVSHPIQYQAPLLRRVNREPDLEVTALFRSDFSIRGYMDEGFGAVVAWDVPLLEGYPHKFLKSVGANDRFDFWRPVNYGLASELRQGGYDALWIHGYGAAYYLYAIALGRLLGIPVLVRDEASNISRRRGLADRIRARLVYGFLRRAVSGFLAIGTANRERYLAMGIKPERIFLVPYAVDNGFFGIGDLAEKKPAKAKVAKRLGLDPSHPQLLFAGKLQTRKRCADLIGAFTAEGVWDHPSRPTLIIAGDGEEMATCRALAETSPASDRIHFLGFQNQTELADLYRAADIFVLTSNAEPWGLTINEAMSAGCAILASDELGSSFDLVRDGQNGHVCRPGDIAAQAQALKAMLDDPHRLRKMGEASLQLIENWGFEQDVIGLRAALEGTP